MCVSFCVVQIFNSHQGKKMVQITTKNKSISEVFPDTHQFNKEIGIAYQIGKSDFKRYL